MRKNCLAICSVLLLAACTKNETNVSSVAPVISFYKGLDNWTGQPTFIYTDTTIKGIKSKMVKVHFAASGAIKHVLVTQNGQSLLDRTEDNETRFNEEFSLSLSPSSAPATYKLYFKVLDYEGRSAERTLTVQYE